FFLFPILSLYPENDYNYDLELWQHIQRIGESSFQVYTKNNGGTITDYNNWDVIIQKTFQKLTESSGKEAFPIRYAIVNNDDFNAFSFPGGQFIVYKGTLVEIDNYIQKMANDKSKNCWFCSYNLFSKDTKINKGEYREGMMAAILAHELSHYYNQHSFKSIKKLISLQKDKGDQIKTELKKISYDREDELDADRSGILLLQKARYKTDWMIVVLKILNEIRQSSLAEDSNQIPFFESHPTPHKRLAELEGKGSDFHKWAAQMEIAYANIQYGRNLEESRNIIKNSIIKYKNNPEFLKAYAICMHKIWEATASLNDLKLKSIINIPTFRDEMLYNAGKKGSKKTPGKIGDYNKALRAYKNALMYNTDPSFLSNYSVLLAYSEKKVNVDKAIQLAEKVHKETEKAKELTIQLENNLGVVYYISGYDPYTKKAYLHFQRIASNLDENLISLYNSDERDTREYAKGLMSSILKKQALDPTYVNEDFTPILNLALIENGMRNSKKAKKISEHYLFDYDSQSEWAVHLSHISNVKPPNKLKSNNNLFANGVKIGDPIQKLLQNWGKANQIEIVGTTEVWYYGKLNSEILIKDGLIAEIFLNGEKSPKVNEVFGVGENRDIIEAVLGKKFKRETRYFNYYQNGNASIIYNKNKAKQIILYK
ncbi:MAG: M48 family metallopeptidase, partial [Leptospiraceae bacterium]|nr:M48 family metallopeptidase [Leptospiraceae bacterium]